MKWAMAGQQKQTAGNEGRGETAQQEMSTRHSDPVNTMWWNMSGEV